MWALVGLVVGAAAGRFVGHEWGAVLGGLAGFFIGAVFAGGSERKHFRKPAGAAGAWTPPPPTALADRVAALERRVAELERGIVPVPTTVALPAAGSAAVAPAIAAATAAAAEQSLAATAPTDAAAPAFAPAADGTLQPLAVPPAVRGAEAGAQAAAPDAPTAAPPPSSPNALWAWFTGGNALTRIGVVVLFIGVAFLLKYFAEHFTVPLELRLAGVAAFGAALVAGGLVAARARPGYGLSLQGAGAGVLYLTIFAAFRLYSVLPATPAIALLAGVSALTVWLAARADAQPLAALAIAGGFLAPMLAPSGGGPVPLFGYCAVLNAAIFALAWVRAWRGLNVLGFVCTFALALTWGYEYYAPEHYRVVQPFLLVFFAFYVAIAILYARRAPLAAKNPVDGLLVFGVPIAAFALQTLLVRDTEYGAATSALVLALVYGVLFRALARRDAPGYPLLSRAFLALAVIFATIAIPLAFDRRATAALWAVEAAGVYWIGMRQRSPLARAFALAVELAAGLVFVASGAGGDGDRLFANATFAGGLLIALAGFVTARIADAARDELAAGERAAVPLAFAWGIGWWLAAGGFEFVRQFAPAEAAHATLGWVVAGVVLALALRGPLAWPRLPAAGIALLPTMAFVAFGDFERTRTTLTHWGWLAFALAWIVHWRALRAGESLPDAAAEGTAPAPGAAGFLDAIHAVSAFALTAQVAWEASEWTGRYTDAGTVWVACAAALPAIAFLAAVPRLQYSARWPFATHGDAYARAAGGTIAALLALWFVAVNVLAPGDATPLPYVPLANPLDATLVVALGALFVWAQRCSRLAERRRYVGLGLLLFVALNGIVLRTAHQWGGIAWDFAALMASKPLQAALTLTWSTTAVAVMVTATRRGLRPLWMVGAALLAVVVAKLFLNDLGALSGLPRIAAFLGVGALLLALGWLSPLPPAAAEPAPSR
jgi:uncharacterized membrane protein